MASCVSVPRSKTADAKIGLPFTSPTFASMSVMPAMGVALVDACATVVVVSSRPSRAATGPVTLTSLLASTRPVRGGLLFSVAGLFASAGWVVPAATKSAGESERPRDGDLLSEDEQPPSAAPARSTKMAASAAFVRPCIMKPATLKLAVVFLTFVLLFGFVPR